MEIQAPEGACISFLYSSYNQINTLTLRLSGPPPDTLILDATLTITVEVIAVRIF